MMKITSIIITIIVLYAVVVQAIFMSAYASATTPRKLMAIPISNQGHNDLPAGQGLEVSAAVKPSKKKPQSHSPPAPPPPAAFYFFSPPPPPGHGHKH
ncbi:hypothetical protein CASFOL_015443 [Castilleja foliolosa]|uniref:Uncharacterized protein n=1 Tax=Castilleja foliolosa TaxID=1961234 RepID=A0ABD3DDR0_9LAMI